MECKVDKPYPTVEVEKANLEYAYLLLEDYTGMSSELTSILQYSYQHFLKFQTNPIIAKTLSTIAMVEMKHLELLGETIKLLGVNPEFKVKDKQYELYSCWNSKYVNYETDLIDILKSDIILEQIAINNYQKHYELINDLYIKSLLLRIIEDEKLHLKCFYSLLNEALKK